MDDARVQHAYYTMVVQSSYDDKWRWVGISGHSLACVSQPHLFSAMSIDKLMELWKRVVTHNAVSWHDNVLPDTLRIVSYNLDIQEVTKKVFGDGYDHERKSAALMLLSDDDARILGLEKEKAQQLIFHQPDFDSDDGTLMNQLFKESTTHNVDNLLPL